MNQLSQDQIFKINSKKILTYFKVAGIMEIIIIILAFIAIITLIVSTKNYLDKNFVEKFNLSIVCVALAWIFWFIKLIMLISGIVKTSELRDIARMNNKIIIEDPFVAGIIGIFLPIVTYIGWYKAAKLKASTEKFYEDFLNNV